MRPETRNTTLASLLADVASGKLTRRQAVQVALATGIALPGLGAAVGASAQGSTPAAEGRPGGTLRVALQADPAELDPHLTR